MLRTSPAAVSPDLVIVDEAHHLRDRASQSYRLVDELNSVLRGRAMRAGRGMHLFDFTGLETVLALFS